MPRRVPDESGCPPEESVLAEAIHAELADLPRFSDGGYYVYKNEYSRPVNTSKTNCCLAAGVPDAIDVVSFDAYQKDTYETTIDRSLVNSTACKRLFSLGCAAHDAPPCSRWSTGCILRSSRTSK